MPVKVTVMGEVPVRMSKDERRGHEMRELPVLGGGKGEGAGGSHCCFCGLRDEKVALRGQFGWHTTWQGMRNFPLSGVIS